MPGTQKVALTHNCHAADKKVPPWHAGTWDCARAARRKGQVDGYRLGPIPWNTSKAPTIPRTTASRNISDQPWFVESSVAAASLTERAAPGVSQPPPKPLDALTQGTPAQVSHILRAGEPEGRCCMPEVGYFRLAENSVEQGY